MTKGTQTEAGFSVVELILGLVIIGALGFVGWRVFGANQVDSTPKTAKTQTNQTETGMKKPEYVSWGFNGERWSANGQAPACESPLTIATPADVTIMESRLFPGQVRGGDFKPHGGLGAKTSTNGEVKVYALRDGYLYRGARYIEGGTVQYMFDVIDPCGVMYRFDHLATLSPEFAAYAEKLPAAKVDDSRTTNFTEQIFVSRGALVATSVGFKNTSNYGFDVGVFDLRQPNEASKSDLYKSDQRRISDKEQSFFAVCWFDLVTGADKAAIKALPPRGAEGSESDYCK